jgi:hypothetical protein
MYRHFLAHERLVSTLHRAVKPYPSALDFASRVACLTTLAEANRAKPNPNPNPPDISQVMGRINGLLDESITGHAIRESCPPAIAQPIQPECWIGEFSTRQTQESPTAKRSGFLGTTAVCAQARSKITAMP